MRNRPLPLLLVAVLASGLLILGSLLLPARTQFQRRAAAIAATHGLPGQMPPGFDQDVAKVVAEIDRIEAETLRQLHQTTLDRQGQLHTLAKLVLFEKHLSVTRNEE